MSEQAKMSYDVVVIGGGTAGISVAARVLNKQSTLKVAIIDPSDVHYYQPAFTLVGAGAYDMQDTVRPMQDVIPAGAKWFKDKVTKLDPDNNKVETENSGAIDYKYLVVAPGCRTDFTKIKGLTEENLGKDGICTIYRPDQAPKVFETLKNFKGGKAIFTQPPMPFKCGGAPQKIMWLTEEYLRNNGLRDKSEVHFYNTGAGIFGVPFFAKTLNELVKQRNILTHYQHKLVEVKPETKEAVFQVLGGESEEFVTTKYDMLHVVPPMSAPQFVQDSPLAVTEGDHKGWLNVDQYTLQSPKYSNVFGLGDAAGIPNAKTGAAVRKEAPVVVENLFKVMSGDNNLTAKYDGYSSCPLITGYGRVVLAEFGYTKPNGESLLLPSFPVIDLSKERRSMWILKKYVLPILYWKFMLKGKA